MIVSIPSTFLDPWQLNFIEIVDFSNLSMRVIKYNYKQNTQLYPFYLQATYGSRFYVVEWKQNDTVLFHDPTASELFQPALTDQITMEDSILDQISEHPSLRRRRAIQNAQLALQSRRSYNRYTRSVQEFQELQTSLHGNNMDEVLDSSLSSLPANRTIFFDCSANAMGCIQAKFTVANFKVSENTPIMISVNFTVNLKAMGMRHDI